MVQITKLGVNSEPEYIILIGPKGTRARLYCPFIAICIYPVGTIDALTTVTVSAVKTTADRRLLYIIQRKAYYHSNFRILIELS